VKIAVALLHIFFATVWLGSSFFYVVLLLPRLSVLDASQQRALTRSLRRAMTPLLGASAVATIASGLVMMVQLHSQHPGSLSHTRWGVALVIGTLASLAALAIAFVIESRLRRDDARSRNSERGLQGARSEGPSAWQPWRCCSSPWPPWRWHATARRRKRGEALGRRSLSHGPKRGSGALGSISDVTYYDLIVVVPVALLAYRGLRVGLVGALLAWLAFGVGLLLAFRFDGVVGGWLAHLHGLAATTWRILAFVAILGVVEIAAGWLARLLGRTLAHLPILGRLNRLGGVLLGALLALILVWLVTVALLFAPPSLVPFSSAVHHSETVHLMYALTPRWEQSLRAYLDNFTTGHLSPRLQQQLRQLTGGRPGTSNLL
jgi:uncharacterized membrane protein required for colicin V production/uncharacterized membrane protein